MCRLFLLLIFTHLSAPIQAKPQDEWPAGFLELEEIALKEPGPGPAFGYLCETAAKSGRLTDLRERWSQRGDVPATVLLGWLEQETSNPADALALFAKAEAGAPTSFHAKWSHAWSLGFLDDPKADEAAKSLLRAARTDDERYAAIHLVSDRHIARSDLAGARLHLVSEFETAQSTELRLLLIPDLVPARITDGTIEKWLFELQRVRAKGRWEDIAVYARTCLELNEPGVALHEAQEGLLRHPNQPALRKIAATSALRADFVTEACKHILAGLPSNADANAVGDAVIALIEAKAGRAICELARRHPAEVAANASRWRSWLPVLRDLGILSELRAALEKSATPEGWEAQVALAEISVLESNHRSAAEHFWAVFAPEANRRPLATFVTSNGNRGYGNFQSLPLAGIQLYSRWEEATKLYYDTPEIFFSHGSESSWKTPTLADARDYSLVCLHRLALLNGTEAAFLDRLRQVTAEWPLDEQLLTAAILGSPEWILHAAESIAAKPAEEVHWYTLSFARNQLAHVVALPWLDPLLASKARATKLPDRQDAAPKSTDLNLRWRGELLKAYNFFLNGKLDEASKAFKEAIPVVRKYGVREIDTFYNGLVSALKAMPVKSRPAGCHLILEWMAQETASRLNLPLPPDFTILTRYQETPLYWFRMFVPPGKEDLSAYGPNTTYGVFPGGLVPRTQSETLWFWRIEIQRSKEPAYSLAETKLTGRERQQLATYLALLATWDGDEAGATSLISELEGSPAEISSRILRVWDERNRQRENAKPKREIPITFKGIVTPTFASHRTAQAVIAPNQASADELGLTHPAAQEQLKILNTLEKSEPAVAGQLALKWAPAVRKDTELSDAVLLLKKYMLGADADGALALAREILAMPPSPTRLAITSADSFASDLPGNIAARLAALTTLDELGELRSWIEDANKRFSANPNDSNLGWALVEAARFLRIHSSRLPQKKKGGLDAHVASFARKIELSALATICRERPEPMAWKRWYAGQLQEAELETFRLALGEFLNSPATESLESREVADLLEMLAVGKRAPILAKLAARNFSPGFPESSLYSLIELAKPLWTEGQKSEALQWWRHLLRQTHPLDSALPRFTNLLLAKCSELGDVDELAGCITDAVELQSRSARGPLAFPLQDMWNESTRFTDVHHLLEIASRHGVTPEVAARLEKKGLTDVALLARAPHVGATGTDELRARLRERNKKPLSNALLDGLAEAIAKEPDPEGLVSQILKELGPYREVPDPSVAVSRMARHGRIAALAGSESATNLLASVAANFQHLSVSQRLNVMPDFLEGAVMLKKPALYYHASKVHAAIYAQNDFDLGPLYSWMQSAADRADRKLFASLSETVQGSVAYKNKTDRAFQKFISLVRAFAAKTGVLQDATPIAWVLPPEADTAPGETLIAWDVGWQTTEPGKRPYLDAAASAGPKADEKYTIEFFGGQESFRMEALRRIEDARPSGTVPIRLPPNIRWLAVCLRTGDKSIMGAPRFVSAGMEFVRLSESLKRPTWVANEGGPGGTYFSQVSIDPEKWDLGTLITTYPIDKNTDVYLSAWVRKGQLKLVGRDAAGKQTAEHTLHNASTLGWNHVETTCGFANPSEGRTVFPESTVKIEVYTYGAIDISTLGVARYRAVNRQSNLQR